MKMLQKSSPSLYFKNIDPRVSLFFYIIRYSEFLTKFSICIDFAHMQIYFKSETRGPTIFRIVGSLPSGSTRRATKFSTNKDK
jgi:hypothetical protein